MARIVRHEKTDPVKIDPQTWPRDAEGNLKPIWVCACGVSRTYPICDGSHKTCRQEEPGHVYRYEPQTLEVIQKSADGPATGAASSDAAL